MKKIKMIKNQKGRTVDFKQAIYESGQEFEIDITIPKDVALSFVNIIGCAVDVAGIEKKKAGYETKVIAPNNDGEYRKIMPKEAEKEKTIRKRSQKKK